MSPRAAFTACWSAEAGRVQAYARRHVGADAAADVVAETFLVVWRRWKDVPEPAQPWLIATARHIIQRHQRSLRRRLALDDRLRLLNGAARGADDAAVLASARADALRHLASLREDHREALLLTAWDGLSTEEAAAVLGVRPGTLRARIRRARIALEQPTAPFLERVATATFEEPA